MASMLQVDGAPFVKLLRQAAPHKSNELDRLISEIAPVFQLETEEERVLFSSRLNPPTITIGLKSTYRLQAHAIAGGVFLSALDTPGYIEMSPGQRGRL